MLGVDFDPMLPPSCTTPTVFSVVGWGDRTSARSSELTLCSGPWLSCAGDVISRMHDASSREVPNEGVRQTRKFFRPSQNNEKEEHFFLKTKSYFKRAPQHIFVDILYETLRVFRERDGTSVGFAQTHCFSQAPQVLSCTHAQLSFVFRKIMHELRVFLFSHEQFPSSFFSFLIRIRDDFSLDQQEIAKFRRTASRGI